VGRGSAAGAPELYRDTVFTFRTPPAPGSLPVAAAEGWKAGSTKTGKTMTIYMMGLSFSLYTYIHTYIHTIIHTYMHTYIHI
jgi:hypothetical protein